MSFFHKQPDIQSSEASNPIEHALELFFANPPYRNMLIVTYSQGTKKAWHTRMIESLVYKDEMVKSNVDTIYLEDGRRICFEDSNSVCRFGMINALIFFVLESADVVFLKPMCHIPRRIQYTIHREIGNPKFMFTRLRDPTDTVSQLSENLDNTLSL